MSGRNITNRSLTNRTITNNELLIRLDEKMGEVLRRMGEQDSAISSIRASSNLEHETLNKRITALENFRWLLIGISTATGPVSNVIINYLRGMSQ